MPDLCSLDDVRQYLQIADDDTSQDDELQRVITATSAQLLNEIRRTDLYPQSSYTDRVHGNGQNEIFLKHYPVVSITSVTYSGVTQDESDGTTAGWFFDQELATNQPEDSRKILLYGLCWEKPYWQPHPIPNIVISYEAGYSAVPEDIRQAVIEWVGFKRGFSQLQQQDQTSVTWQQIGATQEGVTVATSTLKAAEMDMPESVRAVIEKYYRATI